MAKTVVICVRIDKHSGMCVVESLSFSYDDLL